VFTTSLTYYLRHQGYPLLNSKEIFNPMQDGIAYWANRTGNGQPALY